MKKKTFLNTLIGALALCSAVISSCFSAFAVFKVMGMTIGADLVTTTIGRFGVDAEIAFLCVMILVLWVVDLVIRPIIKDLIKNTLALWREQEDDGYTTTTAKDA